MNQGKIDTTHITRDVITSSERKKIQNATFFYVSLSDISKCHWRDKYDQRLSHFPGINLPTTFVYCGYKKARQF